MIAFLVNRFGDAMFRRGVAKPFYIRGHRLHHRDFLLVFIPTVYVVLTTLIVAGFVHIVWRLLWTGLGTTLAIAAACLAVDLAVDYVSSSPHRWGVVHHELIYVLIPAFAFLNFLRV